MAELKETKELLAGVKLLGIAAKKIMKDGKIAVDDLAVLLPVAQQSAILVNAVAGSKDITLEIKDLNLIEAQDLLSDLFALIKEIKEA